jgi:hypothetical protein
MNLLRFTLLDADSKRVRDIVSPVRLTLRDRLWDRVPEFLVVALLWLALLTAMVGWLAWHVFSN